MKLTDLLGLSIKAGKQNQRTGIDEAEGDAISLGVVVLDQARIVIVGALERFGHAAKTQDIFRNCSISSDQLSQADAQVDGAVTSVRLEQADLQFQRHQRHVTRVHRLKCAKLKNFISEKIWPKKFDRLQTRIFRMFNCSN
jgi:hypothetical protein